VIFGFSTAPNIDDNQSNNTGTKTIKAGSPKEANTGGFTLDEIYPNPAAASFNYSLSGSENQTILVRLMDPNGKLVMSEVVNIASGENNFSMNISSLANGIYYLVASDDLQMMRLSKQVVVQH
jgi:hypothetical protein